MPLPGDMYVLEKATLREVHEKSWAKVSGVLGVPLAACPPTAFHKKDTFGSGRPRFLPDNSDRLTPWTGTQEAVSKTITLRGAIYSLLCACQQSS